MSSSSPPASSLTSAAWFRPWEPCGWWWQRPGWQQAKWWWGHWCQYCSGAPAASAGSSGGSAAAAASAAGSGGSSAVAALLVAVGAALLLLLLAVGAALLLLAADGRGAALHLKESIETKCKDLVVTFFVSASKVHYLVGESLLYMKSLYMCAGCATILLVQFHLYITNWSTYS